MNLSSYLFRLEGCGTYSLRLVPILANGRKHLLLVMYQKMLLLSYYSTLKYVISIYLYSSIYPLLTYFIYSTI